MKYIITDKGEVEIGENTFHQILAQNVEGRVVAAGHVRFKDGKAEVYGESFGYGISAKKEDALLIGKWMIESRTGARGGSIPPKLASS